MYFDLLDEQAIKDGVFVIQKSKKPIDILVNVAGIALDALFHMVTMEQLKKTFDINFFSQIYFTQYITKLMLRNPNGGSVVNISSISALDGNTGQLSYASSKAALIAATKTMSAELAPKNIRVNAVAPALIETKMLEKFEFVPESTKMAMLAEMPMGLGTIDDVTSAIIFLLSDASRFITGTSLLVDGGYCAQ